MKRCTVNGCDRKHVARGLCSAHYQRTQNGSLRPDAPLGTWPKRKAAIRRVEASGYVLVRPPQEWSEYTYTNGTILEHRLVMMQHLDRPLRDTETVHHKNGIRTDNRLDNLELWLGKHQAGQRVEDRVADALQTLSDYAPERLA